MKWPNWTATWFIFGAIALAGLWLHFFRRTDTAAAAVSWSGAVAIAIIWFIICALRGGKPTFRHLFNGEDNRPSTSKFQFFLWSVVVLNAFVVLYIARLNRGSSELVGEIPPNLLVAMGLSLGTSVAAKAITANKVASGDVSKSDAAAPPVEAASGVSARSTTVVVTAAKPDSGTESVPSAAANTSTTRLVLDDNGNPDLGKIQLLAWTFVGIGIYLTHVFNKVTGILTANPFDPVCTVGLACGGLPDIDQSLMVLMGLGQAAYLGNKLVATTTPRLTGIDPPIGDDTTPITLTGTGLGDTQNGGFITMDGLPATANLLSSNAQPGWQDTRITFDLPPEHPNPATPYNTLTGPIQIGVIVGGQRSTNTLPFRFKQPPLAAPVAPPPRSAVAPARTGTGEEEQEDPKEGV
jgi:hypothetical protein